MKSSSWTWYLAIGLFYAALLGLSVMFFLEYQSIRNFNEGADVGADFEGNDWVSWMDTDAGVVASRVHPLPFYKPFDPERINEGDRLLSLDGQNVIDAESVDKITRSSPPGKIFVVMGLRTDPSTLIEDKVGAYVKNGFKLSFSFNELGIYWRLSVWIMGIGAFLALIILAILVPILRFNWKDFLPLIGLVVSSFCFFMAQVIHYLYLIVESDLVHTGFEKGFIVCFQALLFCYVGFYFRYKSNFRNFLWVLPTLLVGLAFMGITAKIIAVDHQLKYFSQMIERNTLLFALLHIAGGIGVFLTRRERMVGRRERYLLIAGMAMALGGMVFLITTKNSPETVWENGLFFFQLLLFFPLVNATFLQLQFGKVSLVVTQTLQYLTVIVISILLFLLITQFYEYLLPTNQYRRILEFVTFVIVAVIIRLLYIANENKLNRYFVSSQKEKSTRFRSFVARIPQYTNAMTLRNDLSRQVADYFQSEPVIFWWKSENEHLGEEILPIDMRETIYAQLSEDSGIWSKTKEITGFRLDEATEKLMQRSAIQLVSPITVDHDEHGLLMLGRKRRGVYNLSDLEMISQLIQQTQLTLNVLQLLSREKDLLQQTYEANLTALRSQINPHFLFNTLNTISALIHDSPNLAEAAVEKLAFIFRYTLKVSSQNFVPLANEVELVSTYLDIEKIRFGERLETSIEVEQDTRDVMIPAFILQTLTENCIKHGIAKILGKGRVSIAAFREEGFLICEVIDNGPGIDLNRIYKSTGLSNSIARLENMYGIKNLLYFENTGNGTYVRLRVPLEKKPDPTPMEA